MKEKKELKYPYEKFDWKKSFERISDNARYENEKILIDICDRNLYLEVKNAIEEQGGYVEVQLNPSLLQIPVEYYFDFISAIGDEADKKAIIEGIRNHIKKNDADIELIEEKSIREQLRENGVGVVKDIILDFAIGSIPNKTVRDIAEKLRDVINI